jgi:hypothetical protein
MNPTTAEADTGPFAERSAQTRPQPGVWDTFREGLKPLASLQVTVVLFALSILLVFFGTLAQVDFGIWTVVDKYFWSWIVMVPGDLFNKFGQVFLGFPKGVQWGWSFPLPGGKLLGGAMLVNLLAAHLVRFKLSWKRSGIMLIHSGLILLFVGEFVTREYAVEQRMSILEGSTATYTEDNRTVELAVVDQSDPAEDQVTVVPQSMLRSEKGRITHPDLPVDLQIVEFLANASLVNPDGKLPNPATAGTGKDKVAVRLREVSGVEPNQKVDLPAAYVTLYKKGTDVVIGTYLTSLELTLTGLTEEFEAAGKKYEMSLRFKRYPKKYSLQLLKFRFDRYPGTEKAKNYSSQVILRDPEQGVQREVTIEMNVPLRHRGETFYQSNFDKAETTTYLQVVNNPGWLIPYTSCVVVTLGMLIHFGISLIRFLNRRILA